MLVGLAFSIVPEIVNQIYVRKDILGYWFSVVIYVVLLVLLFFLRKIFILLIRNKTISAFSWYVLLGILGLIAEWNILGNADAAIHGQVAMFTFWGSLGLVPVIFTEEPAFPDLKKIIKRYASVWMFIFLIAGIFNPGLGLLIWILGCIWLNYYYFAYFKKLWLNF